MGGGDDSDDGGSLRHLGADIPLNYNGLFESEEAAEVIWSVELLSPSKLTMKEKADLAEHNRSRALFKVNRQTRERAVAALETARIAAAIPSRGGNRDRFGEDTEKRILEEEAAAASSLLGIRLTVRTEPESSFGSSGGMRIDGERAQRSRERDSRTREGGSPARDGSGKGQEVEDYDGKLIRGYPKREVFESTLFQRLAGTREPLNDGNGNLRAVVLKRELEKRGNQYEVKVTLPLNIRQPLGGAGARMST